MTIEKIVKRDGTTVDFDEGKVTNAIFRAAQSIGGSDRGLAADLSKKVVKHLEGTVDGVPNVEQVQDAVEKILIEEGHAKTAKAYILYRQKRTEIREEKKHVLEKDEIDEVDKQFDVNALRVLKARYLRKDDDGKLTETPKELFTRVATHAALPDLIYDERVYDKSAGQEARPEEEFDYAAIGEKLSMGNYSLNKYHLEALKMMYDRAARDGEMKVPWREFLGMLKSGDFNRHAARIDEFFDAMVSKRFMPNTPAVANFGGPLGMGSACFVLGVEDDLTSIMDTLKHTAIIHQAGGGTGFNFSKLRPEGDIVKSTCGIASGPISFMSMYDNMTDVIKQGGMRRGANMGILNSDHPDIEKFITAKEGNKALRNFNISVLIKPDFWEHLESGEPYPLKNPRTGEVAKTVDAKNLFDKIVYQAWESAEPGVIFFDHVNKYNPFLEHMGPIVTTNPCGEVLLYSNEPCNLGSVNVWRFYDHDSGEVDWEGLKQVVITGTRFLDNVIDVNMWPLDQIEEMARNTRKIGLGMMGVAQLMYELGLPYNSEEGRAFMEKLMEFVNYWSKHESIELAKERGSLPYYDKSFYPEGRLPFAGFEDPDSWNFDWREISERVKTVGIRHGYTTVIAPTGSISMITGCSSGIEPVFSLVFEKNVKVGSFFYVDHVFERIMQKHGLYDKALMEDIAENAGRVTEIGYIPPELKEIFVTAYDISPEDHIRALAAFQKWTDSSISKTNNFPADATTEDMKKSYLLAYQLGCKDVTVFRDSSIKNQVLVSKKKEERPSRPAAAKETQKSQKEAEKVAPRQPAAGTSGSSSKGKCPTCDIPLQTKEGCASCPSCGYGLCSG